VDDNLQQAELTLSKAERIRTDAQEWQASMEVEIQFRLDDASRKRASARTYAAQLEETARSASDSLMTQTRSGAEELASRMRTDTAEDIRKILAEIDSARAVAEDELEAQRLLTETTRVRAFTVGLNVEDSRVEQDKTSSAPKAKKPVKRATSTKKRTTRAKALKHERNWNCEATIGTQSHIVIQFIWLLEDPRKFSSGFFCAGHQSNVIPACVGDVRG
jgi:hypothetical protein